MSRDCLNLEAVQGLGGCVILGPIRCNNGGDSSWQATTPRALRRQQTETHPSLSENEAYLLFQELWTEGQASGLAHRKVSEGLLVNRIFALSCPLSCPDSPLSYRKEFIPFPGALVFVAAA